MSTQFNENLTPAKSSASTIVRKSMTKALKTVVKDFFVPPKKEVNNAVVFQSHRL